MPVHHWPVHVERTSDWPDIVVVVHTTSDYTVFGVTGLSESES